MKLISSKFIKPAFFIGITLILLGIFGIYILNKIVKFDFDEIERTVFRQNADPCDDLLFNVNFSFDKKVVIEEAFNLDIHLRNLGREKCWTTTNIYATTFEVQGPKDKMITIPAGGRETVSWNLNPKKVGLQEIIIETGSEMGKLKFTVVKSSNDKISSILSKIATFLGATLTLPFWLNLIEKRKAIKSEKNKTILFDSSGMPIKKDS